MSIHTDGCPAGDDARLGCSCLLRGVAGQGVTRYGARGPLSDPPLLGEYVVVTYSDHVAAVAAARAEERNKCIADAADVIGEQAHGHYMDGYNKAWSLSAAEIERATEQRVREEEQAAQTLDRAFFHAEGWNDALAAAVARVEALAEDPMNHMPECAWFCTDGPCDCVLSEVTAAITGGSDE